jgi:transcriptional antiterminator RfaH
MVSWIVINTHTHKEALALENLQRQGFSAYCPVILKNIRHARQVREELRPLFPSYVFVRFGSRATLNWKPMTSTYGVRSVVQCGDRPSLLDNAFIEGLRAREVDGVVVQSANAYKVGQKVRLEGGPFDGVLATIIELSEKDRLIVLMDLLKSSVRAQVAVQSVSAV